ncbi:hypothetical protein PPACK8108_LOCUS476 [Phakopsora pachyrhizi]|uniref:No apical meristem-associated C-terminal domain-containing protein n=1 Tax=Phakopsora pachyrhizi TaxID=170000 RepID=A0AAV0ADQ9_PHAPC|nr:hypothetical protein PPACK8108_LOCUS476 [Phakopsora pachyrhizi]
MSSTSNSASSLSSKKKQSPNWLPLEEEQLAVSWIHVSEQPKFAANQSGKTFYKKVEVNFNQWSTFHYRDYNQIRISGSSPMDWMKSWEKLCCHPKWRFEKKDVVMQPFVSSPPSSKGLERPESSDPGTPTSITTTSSQQIGSKAAKRQRLSNLELDEDKNIQAQEFNAISKQRLLVIQEGNEILKEKNELQKKQLKIEEEKLIIEKEHRTSEVMISRTLTLWKFLS